MASDWTHPYLQEKPLPPPHHPALLRALAKEAQCEPADIVDFELNVCDTVPGTIGGDSSAPFTHTTMLCALPHADLQLHFAVSEYLIAML